MPKIPNIKTSTAYNDRSKVKTIFNLVDKEIYRIIDIPITRNISKRWDNRGLPDSREVQEEIKNILSDIDESFIENKIAYYKMRLRRLVSEILRYAEEKERTKLISIDINSIELIDNVESFKTFCRSCLLSAHTLGQHQMSMNEVYSFPSSLIKQTIVNNDAKESLSKKIIDRSSLDDNSSLDTNTKIEQYDTSFSPTNINDIDKFRKEFKIGFFLSDLRFQAYDKDEKIEILKTLLPEENYNKIFKDVGFDFKNIRLSFFLNPSLSFSSVNILGYICSYCYYCRKQGAFDEHKAEVLKSLEQLHLGIAKNDKALLALLAEISYFSYASQCENILKFLNPAAYDNDNSIHTIIRAIMENYIFDNNSLTDIRQYIVTTRKLARTTGNNQMVEACDWLIDKIDDNTIDDDYLQDRKKYRLWASDSLWEDTDYFESLCMDLIEALAIENDTRNDAIESTKHFLSTAKKGLTKERDIQIYERVLLEFNIATDEEYNELRATLLD